ncbi:MAG TPA: DNA ligase D [Flavipsychrobacter sp.]|nr:DNA ligase D [Flavipsychrobacter sp.]
MSIPDYNRKRRFNETPEPAGKIEGAKTNTLQFVIQKHNASHLHYDLRIELSGVLISWAVPKGLSLDPSVKRLAMKVEDHPYDYKDFEGIIPAGNYGAGTVIVWDRGRYEPVGLMSDDKKEMEKYIRAKLHKGELKFWLHGEKLKGAFALIKTKNSAQENAWLVYKLKDEFADKRDITIEGRSVISGLTIEEVAATSEETWKSNRKSKKVVPQNAKPATKKTLPNPTDKLIQQGKKSSIPAAPSPMLATLQPEPFDNPDWLFEIKWDGYRAIAKMEDGNVELSSRNGITLKKFYPVADALEALNMNAVLDGEIVVLDDEGRANFQMLQLWTKEQKGTLCFMVFDLLWYNGYDFTDISLTERKTILEKVLPENNVIKYCDHVMEKGKDFYNLSVSWGIEGIIAKKANSNYVQGKRSKNWLKLKNANVLEAVIAGFTKGRNSRKYFGALILAQYEQNEIKYIGHTGSGLDEKTTKAVYEKLMPLVTEKHPFKTKPKTNMPATWVKPELVCEVKYQERTKDGILRIPIFLGLREDKNPMDLKQETQHLEQKKTTVENEAQEVGNLTIPKNKKTLTIIINNKELQFTNLDKLYWKNEKITKRDMLNYYAEVMPFILTYMRDRPQSLNRHPNGIDGKSFYQKDVKGKVADWITTHGYVSESDGEQKDFLVCTNEASLMYIANLGCIEMNPWHSRIQHPDNPDWCVIDLDPDDISFEKVVETALVVKTVLDSVNVKSYCKTSGSTGLHIYVPLGAKYSYEQSKVFAEIIANIVHHELPNFTSVERSPAKRRGKIYIDYLQNRNIQTIAAPYSLRPKPMATASAPLHWSEVKKGLSIAKFTIHNMKARIKKEGDLFTGVMGEGIDLNAVVEKLLRQSYITTDASQIFAF